MEERYCTECGCDLADDECFDGGICEDCYEMDALQHEADVAELNKPLEW